jgi:pimeloyl-ACP methyl ester carboxylesterase
VVGVLADCGYTTAPAIIKKVIRHMGLPADLLYPLVRLGAILYGGFDPNEADCPRALANATLPIIFFHGETDDFVPCAMSRENYDACVSEKQLVVTPGAGHGLCYPADEEGYIAAVRAFDEKYWR